MRGGGGGFFFWSFLVSFFFSFWFGGGLVGGGGGGGGGSFSLILPGFFIYSPRKHCSSEFLETCLSFACSSYKASESCKSALSEITHRSSYK